MKKKPSRSFHDITPEGLAEKARAGRRGALAMLTARDPNSEVLKPRRFTWEAEDA